MRVGHPEYYPRYGFTPAVSMGSRRLIRFLQNKLTPGLFERFARFLAKWFAVTRQTNLNFGEENRVISAEASQNQM
jgi:hypothetical protein